jgi:hypothetical protein
VLNVEQMGGVEDGDASRGRDGLGEERWGQREGERD